MRVEVVVELSENSSRSGDAALREHLDHYLRELVSGVQIPAEPSLTIETQRRPQASTVSPYAVRINGRKCRTPVASFSPQDTLASNLDRSVAAVIADNRELLITEPLVEQVRHEWTSDTGKADAPGFTREEWRQLLAELVRRGIGLGRTQAAFRRLQQEEPTTLTPATLIEAALAGDGTPSLTLLLGPESAVELAKLAPLLENSRANLFWELGVNFPLIKTEEISTLSGSEFQVQVNDVRLEWHDLTGKIAGDFSELAQTLEAALRNNAGAFVTTEFVAFGLSTLRANLPDLVRAAQRFDIVTLTRILRSLVDEGFPIRDLDGILENLLAVNGSTAVDLSKYIVFAPHTANFYAVEPEKVKAPPTVFNYVNALRAALRRAISSKYSQGTNTLPCFPLDVGAESRIQHVTDNPLSDDERETLLTAILRTVGSQPGSGVSPVIVTSALVRRPLRKLIEKEFPWLAVLSYQELAPQLNLQVLGRISWPS